MVVFLANDKGESCSGNVSIAKGEETYLLSGSDETWNNESANAVCRQMHCGKASHYGFLNSSLNADKHILHSCNFSSNATSDTTFECEMTKQPPDRSIATVNCSGNVLLKFKQYPLFVMAFTYYVTGCPVVQSN